MARTDQFFPSIHYNGPPKPTRGERRFATCLLRKLDNESLVWLGVRVRGHYPDFILLHPERGFVTLEVKDWLIDSILKTNSHTFTLSLRNPSREKRVVNPLEQAREYAIMLHDCLEESPLLRQREGEYKGHLLLPWSHMAVLTRITRGEFEAKELSKVMPEDHVICQDEMSEHADTGAFLQRLWKTLPFRPKAPLTAEQINEVRGRIFPELVIGQSRQTDLPLPDSKPTTPTEYLRVLDRNQERIARELRDGHQVIHGAAGTGKTVLLKYRLQHLYNTAPKEPVLAVCFNKNLAEWISNDLRNDIDGINSNGAFEIRSFHGWCLSVCKRYKLSLSGNDDPDNPDKYVEAVVSGVESGLVPSEQYSAILIDEGHDFRPDWIRLLTRMVKQETKRLLMLYDSAQNIYGNQSWTQNRKIRLKDFGIEAQGRTSILRANYRNPLEITKFAYEFLSGYIESAGGDDEIPRIHPEAKGLRGSLPIVRNFADNAKELDFIGKRVRSWVKNGTPWEEIAVLCRFKHQIEHLCQVLSSQDIPVAKTLSVPGIRVMTMHACKGLEFRYVVIHNVGNMPRKNSPEAEEARLLYVAMTRATEQLLITHHQTSGFALRCQSLARSPESGPQHYT